MILDVFQWVNRLKNKDFKISIVNASFLKNEFQKQCVCKFHQWYSSLLFQMTRRAYFLCSIRVIRGQSGASQKAKKLRHFG